MKTNKENGEELLRLQKEVINIKRALRYAEGIVSNFFKNEVVSDSSLFASLVPIVMNFAPDGKMPSYPFESRKIIFKMFLSLFHDPKVFSFNCCDDCRWARAKGYLEYLQLVDKENPKEESKNA